MFNIVRRWRFRSIANVERKIDKVQRSPHMPEDRTGEKNEPGEKDEDIVVKDTAKDAEAHVEAEKQEAERNADAGPYNALCARLATERY